MKMYQWWHSVLLLGVMLFNACANYKPNYLNGAKDWAAQEKPIDQKIRHSIFLIGDTGDAEMGETLPIFSYLKKELATADENSSIIFLGDNIYPVGMPPKDDPFRPLAEHKLNVQLEMLDDYKGQIMFIPGNHDWSKYGLKGVERQEKYIEKYLNGKRGVIDNDHDDWNDYFMPSKGCGDPEVIEVNDQLVIVLIDSQWWLQNWDIDQSINDGCDIKSRSFFKFQFEEILRKHRTKNVVVAMHHPLYSNGPHGGYYTAKEHLFPLTPLNKNLYVPMPGFGSLVAFFRGVVGVPQDLANGKYNDMRDDVLAGATKNGSYIFVSGHEHTLQYLEKKRQHFIVSGAGSKENPARVGGGGIFGYGKIGYAKMDFYEDGTTWVSYWTPDEVGVTAKEVFRKQIKGPLAVSKNNVPTSFPEYEEEEFIKIRPPNNYNLKPVGPLHKATLGEHYLDLYLKDYPFEVLRLDTFKGGVFPVKRGGGNQTNSLRLENDKGKQYTMRSLTKDASRALPYPINQISGAEAILEDNFLAAYPFAALVLPTLADAANVYHTNPKLYYIPKQPLLGLHNDVFGGDVYLVEERPDDNWEEEPSFGRSKKIMSTFDVIEKRTKNHNHRIDESWVIRSRLLDILVKDWDRHDDQWRWARFEEEDGKYYRPIPRDRDQAFSKYDGILIKFIGAVSPFYRQLQKFTPNTIDIRWANWNTKYFDTNFIAESEREDWEREAQYIQKHVTDEVIEKAFQQVPLPAQNQEWQKLIEYTKKRRDNLLKIALKAYEYNAEQVDVLGTEKRDLFEVIRMNDSITKVRVYDITRAGEKQKKIYDRTFENGLTKEIHLYGLGNDDLFKVAGEAEYGIILRIVGGVGKDTIYDESLIHHGRKKTLFYDASTESNLLVLGKEGKDKTSTDTEKNLYVRKHNQYHADYTIPLPRIGFNQDDGFLLGFHLAHYDYRFKKFPYGALYRLEGDFATQTNSWDVAGNAEWIEAIGRWDITAKLNYRGDRYSFNHFGFGNETNNPDPEDLAFNRVRQGRIFLSTGLRRSFADGNGKLVFMPMLERTQIENTPNRFISSDANPESINPFGRKWYAGIRANLEYENLDQRINPQKGMRFQMFYDVETNLENRDLTFGKFGTNLTLYGNIDRQNRWIWATKLGYESIRGKYDFFKAPTIGGQQSLRGYRQERFRGDKAFFHAIDLRYKAIASINKVLPFSLGIHGGFDYGRIWLDGEDSERWHSSYGGGIWLAPVNAIVLSFGQYYSSEDNRFLFTVGHQF